MILTNKTTVLNQSFRIRLHREEIHLLRRCLFRELSQLKKEEPLLKKDGWHRWYQEMIKLLSIYSVPQQKERAYYKHTLIQLEGILHLLSHNLSESSFVLLYRHLEKIYQRRCRNIPKAVTN